MYPNAAIERKSRSHIDLNFIKKVNGFGQQEEKQCSGGGKEYSHHSL